MLDRTIALIGAAALGLTLSACASAPLISASSPTYVSVVEVDLKATATAKDFVGMVRNETLREASRYARSGAPQKMRIVVDKVHYKNPVLAATLGDDNAATADVAVIDEKTGETRASYSVISSHGNSAMNLGGVLHAISQDRAAVDADLARGLATQSLRKLYGSKAADEAATRPAFAEIPMPGSSPAAR